MGLGPWAAGLSSSVPPCCGRSLWLFNHSLFSLCFFSRRTTSAHGANLGSLKNFLKSQGTLTMRPAPLRQPVTRAGILLRTWISTYSPCRRATASLPSGFSMTALRFRSGPTCSRKTTGTLRTGGSESTSPGIDTVQGSRGLASPHGVPLAGTRAFPRWKGSFSSWSMVLLHQQQYQT